MLKSKEFEGLAVKAIEWRRIQHAVGHRVDRIIRDEADHVLLDEDDVVTLTDIEHARQSGVLDRMLTAARR